MKTRFIYAHLKRKVVRVKGEGVNGEEGEEEGQRREG